MAADDEVAEHGAWSDTGELVLVADEDQPCLGLNGPQQPGQQRQVNHRCLVDDKRLSRQVRLDLTPPRLRLQLCALTLEAEQLTVDRVGVAQRGVRQAFSSLPGGRQQHVRDSSLFEEVDQDPHARSLANARAAADDRHLVCERGRDGPTLVGFQHDLVGLLRRRDRLLQLVSVNNGLACLSSCSRRELASHSAS